MSEKVQPPLQVQLSATQELVRGVPTNRFQLVSDNSGFVVSFLNYVMGEPVISLTARVCMSPESALALMEALAENIKNFEASCGPIRRLGSAAGPEILFDATKAS